MRKELNSCLPLELFAVFILTLSGTLCYVFKSLSKTGVGNLCFKVQLMSKLSYWKIALSVPDKLFFRRSLKVSDLHWSVNKFVSGICKGQSLDPFLVRINVHSAPETRDVSIFVLSHIMVVFFR